MKSSLENLLSEQLQGLLLPPEETGHSWVIIGGSLLLCLLAVIVWRWQQHRNTPIEIAKREISALRSHANKNHTISQNTAIHLVKLLRRGLNVTRLDEYKPQNIAAWNTFNSQLNAVCYSTTELTDINLIRLFEESLDWLSSETT